MSTSKVDLAFWYMRSKYCSWWSRRVSTPELLDTERRLWSEMLESYSFRQIRDGAFVVRRYYRFRPPYASEFARLMDRRANRPIDVMTGRRFDRPEHSATSRQCLSAIKAMLGSV